MSADTPSAPSNFMLLFQNAGPEPHQHLTPDQKTELMHQRNNWHDGLAVQGKIEQGRPLELAGRRISMEGGRFVDGPFVETKEAIGGFFMLRVADIEEAVAVAKQCPSLPLGLTVEVRLLAECSPVLKELRGRPPS